MINRRLIRWPIRELTYSRLGWFLLLATCLAQETALPEDQSESANTQPLQIETIDAHDEYVYLIDFSVDGKTMVTAAGDNRAILWDWPNRKLLHSLPHDAAVYAAQIRPDGKQIATSSGDGRVAIWDARNGTKIKEVMDHQDAVHCLAYSADGKYLASIGGDGRKGDTDCRIWSSQDLTLIQKLPGHQRPAYWVAFGVAFSPSDQMLLTAGGDQRINFWSLSNLESDNDPLNRQQGSIVGHDSDVYRCDISDDGRWLATAGQDKTIKIWDLNSIHPKRSAANSENEKHKSGLDPQVSTLAEDIAPAHTLGETKDPYYAANFSHDGKFLATTGDDGSVRVWNTKDYHLSETVKLSSAALYAVAITPDNQQIVAGGTDGNLFVLNVAELKGQQPR